MEEHTTQERVIEHIAVNTLPKQVEIKFLEYKASIKKLKHAK
jgi:hypothetical protein